MSIEQLGKYLKGRPCPVNETPPSKARYAVAVGPDDDFYVRLVTIANQKGGVRLIKRTNRKRLPGHSQAGLHKFPSRSPGECERDYELRCLAVGRLNRRIQQARCRRADAGRLSYCPPDRPQVATNAPHCHPYLWANILDATRKKAYAQWQQDAIALFALRARSKRNHLRCAAERKGKGIVPASRASRAAPQKLWRKTPAGLSARYRAQGNKDDRKNWAQVSEEVACGWID